MLDTSAPSPLAHASASASARARTQAAWAWLLLAIVVCVAVLAFDKYALGLRLLREGRTPDFSVAGAWHAAAWAVFAALLGAAIAARMRALAGGLTEPLALTPVDGLGRLGWQGVLLGIAAFPLILLLAPHKFTRWALEDHWVEWGTVVCLLLGMTCCVPAALRRRAEGRPMQMAAILLLGFVLFLVAGEEVSWLQRVFQVKTPDSFARNEQHEMNLHNFATNATENAYYFCAGFVLLVVAPLWRALRLPPGPLAGLVALTPQPYLIGIGALIAAHNYNMWDGALMQFAFWGSAGVLGALAWAHPAAAGRRTSAALLGGMLVVQAIYLLSGHRSERAWDVTEYRELLIAAALLLYSFDLWRAPAAAD